MSGPVRSQLLPGEPKKTICELLLRKKSLPAADGRTAGPRRPRGSGVPRCASGTTRVGGWRGGNPSFRLEAPFPEAQMCPAARGSVASSPRLSRRRDDTLGSRLSRAPSIGRALSSPREHLQALLGSSAPDGNRPRPRPRALPGGRSRGETPRERPPTPNGARQAGWEGLGSWGCGISRLGKPAALESRRGPVIKLQPNGDGWGGGPRHRV